MKSFKKFIVTEIAEPLFRRLGTGLGAYLVGLGVAREDATVIVSGAVALAGIVMDLVWSHLERKR